MKILKPKLLEQADIILNEAETLKKIDHPNVIKVLDVQSLQETLVDGTTSNKIFTILELA